MAKSLSLDLRRRVIAAMDGGMSCREAAERFGISAACAVRGRSRQREAGDFAPKQQGGDPKSRRNEAHAPLILNTVDAKSDITLAELRDKSKDHGVTVSMLRSGDSSNAERSRLKKDGARRRETP